MYWKCIWSYYTTSCSVLLFRTKFLSTCYKPGHFYETRRSILTCVSELLRIDYILTNNRDNCHARHYFFRVETAEQLLSPKLMQPYLLRTCLVGWPWLWNFKTISKHNESTCRCFNYQPIFFYIYKFKLLLGLRSFKRGDI